MPGELRAPLVTLDPLAEGTASVRVSLVTSDPLSEGAPNLRSSLVTGDALSEGYRNLRVALLVIESLHPIDPEGTVSTELFPGSMGSPTSLPGLSFSIHKRPTFSTVARKAQSGVSVRNAQMQYPVWELELSYEFLRDKASIGLDEYRTLRRFFLARKGGFDTFLLKDPDDYLVTNGTLGTADGVTTQFPFVYEGGLDKVGQVDNGNTITLYATVAEGGTIPNTPGPYTITAAHAGTFVQDLGVTKAGVAMTKVTSAPAAGQYSVSAGVYTFNSADHSAAVVITYRYVISSGYTVTLPNLLVFTSAPANGLVISADFQFFYNLRFQEDVADFQKFADRFWDLQQIVLESVPQ